MSVQGTFVPDNLIAGDNPQLVAESVLIPSGTLARGTVLGRQKVTVPTTGVIAGTGDGTCTAVTGGPDTQVGAYVAKCIRAVTNGGEFIVTNPLGQSIGNVLITAGAGGTGVFKSKEINLTITDGTSDFAVGDTATVTVTGVVPASASVTGTGNGTCTLIEARRDLKKGTYRVQCTVAGTTHGGTFTVTDPDGFLLQTVSMPDTPGGTVDFDNDQIAGRLTDGSTNFIVGDYFDIVVAIHPRQCVILNKAATDGSSVPYGILLEAIDASSAAKPAAVAIEGEFNQRALIFATGTDIEDVRDQMRNLNMIVRMTVAA
jgi:hypothetical protein